MKKFVYSAIALSMATGVSYANNGWTTLDQEISGLSSSLTAQNAGGPKVGGWVITSVRSQSDVPNEDAGVITEADELGFNLDEVRLHVTGDVSNDYSYKVSFEFEEGAAELKDAYINWKVMDSITGTMGRFYKPTLNSSMMDETKTLFLGRSLVGGIWNDRDEGAMVAGNFEMVNFWLAVQNGGDSTADELDFTLRVTADVMGKGAGSVEGAYGAAEGTNLSVGAFIASFGSTSDVSESANDLFFQGLPLLAEGDLQATDDTHFGAEAYFSMGALAVTGEYTSATLTDGVGEEDLTGWALTGSYLFTEMYEAAVRIENLDVDNTVERQDITVGVNRYSAGHNLKWTAQFKTSDVELADGTDISPEDEIAIGATLAF